MTPPAPARLLDPKVPALSQFLISHSTCFQTSPWPPTHRPCKRPRQECWKETPPCPKCLEVPSPPPRPQPASLQVTTPPWLIPVLSCASPAQDAAAGHGPLCLLSLSALAPRNVGCSPSWEPFHRAKGTFLIFTGMKTFPKSKCWGGFEEFPLEMKWGCLRAPAIAAELQLLGTPRAAGEHWAAAWGCPGLDTLATGAAPRAEPTNTELLWLIPTRNSGSTLGIVRSERQPTKG